MFIREINETTFTTDIADELFSNITGDGFRYDRTFISTMRALLFNRMDEGETVKLTFAESCKKVEDIRSAGRTKKSVMSALFTQGFDLTTTTGQLLIHSLTDSDEENNSAIMELTRESFSTAYGKDYVRAEDLALFMKKLAEVDFYINKKLKTTVILVNKLDMKTVHMLQAMLPRIFPWYFLDRTPAAPVEEDEKKLLCSLGTKNSVDYITLIEQLASKFDFRTAKVRKFLKGFENIFDERQLDSIKRKIESIDEELKTIELRYAQMLRSKHENQTMQLGIRQRMSEKRESEVMDYFLCNKTLHLDEVNGTVLEFIVEAHIDNYDPDLFERNIDNKRSVFYNHTNDRFSEDDVKLLLTSLFGDDPVLKIRTCAAFSIDVGEFTAHGLSGYNYPTMFENHLPNQHIHRYACLGTNETYISQCLERGDYILAIEQCASAARNFNIADSTVADKFMEEIFSPNARRFIERPDGSVCTPYEALQWLKESNDMEVIKDE